MRTARTFVFSLFPVLFDPSPGRSAGLYGNGLGTAHTDCNQQLGSSCG